MFDLVLIGAGSGGVRCARIAASLGAKVAVVEAGPLGGTCVNIGCVPKKLFSYAAQYGENFEDSAGFGWQGERPEFNWRTLVDAKDAEILRLNGIYERMLEKVGVVIVHGRGVVEGPNQVRVGDRILETRRIVVATGCKPWVPDVPGRELALVSDDLFTLPTLPKRMAIIGGGYIAVEFASIFAGLGVEIELLYRGDLFLRGFDRDLRVGLAAEMRKRGISVRMPFGLKRIEKTAEGLVVHAPNGDTVTVDQVLMATGRSPNTAGLNLEAHGVGLSKDGGVLVDGDFATAVPSIFAIGDVIQREQLTPVALGEGMVLAHNLFGEGGRHMDYADIPTAVFTTPNLGTVGMTEGEARHHCDNVVIYRSNFRAMKHTLSGRDERTIMKIVVDGDTNRVVGCHMMGPDAGEIIQGLAVAIRCGATKADFDRTIGIHPTAAEEFVTMRTPVSED